MRKLLTALLLISTAGSLVWADKAQDTLDFYKQELTSFPARNTRDVRAYALALADGLDTWILQNEKQTPVHDAMLLQARLLERAEEDGAVLVTLFKLRYLFDQADMVQITPLFTQTVTELNKDSRPLANELLAKGASQKATTPVAKEAEALYALSKLSGSDFYPAATQAFERFFVRYPNYEGNNEVELWYGDLHRANGNYLAAISQYKKADLLYPSSPYKAASLRLIGDIYADNLKNTAAATEAYTTVLRLYPGSNETGIVYKHMAILDENNRQYDSALINYDKAIELLDNAPSVYEAYRGKADVYNKMKQPGEAYHVLHQAASIANLPADKAADALKEAGDIARRKLHDETKYIKSLERAILLQPTAPETAQLMYELGTCYEKQGKTAQAQEAYKKLILQFPISKYAAKAQNRLTRLSNQTAKAAAEAQAAKAKAE